MSQASQASHPSRHVGSGSAVVSSLYVMAFIVGATSLVAVLFQLSVAFSGQRPVLPEEIIYIIAGGVAGVAVGLLLGAFGVILSHMYAQTQMMHRLVRSQEDAAGWLSRMSTAGMPLSVPLTPSVPDVPAAQQPSWSESQRIEQILEILTELNENMMLTPEQRQAKRCRQIQETQRGCSDAIDSLLTAGKIVEAQMRLDQYVRLLPDDPTGIEQCQHRIDQARAAVEDSEYEQALAKVHELTAAAAWDRADEVARALLKRHPKSERVRALADHVRQEQAKFQQQHRQHLFAQIEDLGAQRQWREAYRLASELLNQFGNSPEGQIIRDKMATLKDNAEIETRRDLEYQYKELYRGQRYIEALALAQDVIAKYPESPQAKALREQMPQLMSKAKMQMDRAGGA